MFEKTPLEDWIKRKIDGKSNALNREQLTAYQLNVFIENIEYVKKNSPFYRDLLESIQTDDIKTLADISKIPFTTDEDIKIKGNKMVCASQREISRIITLDTSGTTGLPKRIYFTEEDQALTIDFFHSGMSTFAKPGEKVLILLPGRTTGSIGNLLRIALKRMDVEAIVYGIVDDVEKVEEIILNEEIDGIVGIPQQVFALSESINARKIKGKSRLKHVLLSTDYVSNAIVRKIKENWGSEVYEHYGMSEMGLGGGVFCQGRNGYHLREADMLFEIIDHITGKPVRDGEFGEVVFTTLTRKGMPLIRYRTGDISRFIEKPCDCGTILKTMDKVQYRIASSIALSCGYVLTMSELEEILFDLDGMVDFDATLTIESHIDCLNFYINIKEGIKEKQYAILSAIEESNIGKYVSNGLVKINIEQQAFKVLDIKAIKKRKIIDRRK